MGVQVTALAITLALFTSSRASDSPGRVQRPNEAPRSPSALRPIVTDALAFTVDVSRDGRKAVSITNPYGRGSNEEPSRIEIRDLVMGRTIVLTGGESPAGSPGRPAAVFSPDSGHVAYTWLDAKLQGTGNLNVIAASQGATPRTVVSADDSDRGVIPHGWSADGRRILVLIHGASDRMEIEPTSLAWVSLDDGTIRTIETHETWRGVAGAAAQPRLSPDGTMIAYSAIAKSDSSDRAIYVINSVLSPC